MIYAQADTELERKAIEKASSGIFGIAIGADDPNSINNDYTEAPLWAKVKKIGISTIADY